MKSDLNINQLYLKRAQGWARLFAVIPFLRVLCVCNSVSFSTANKDSDIDLFIIAKSGRLFTVRTIMTLLATIFLIRRGKNKTPGSFCLSFFVTDKHLDLSPISILDDYYLAYWTKSLIPILDDGAFELFKSVNIWPDNLFEEIPTNLPDYKISAGPFAKSFNIILEFILCGRLGDFIEKSLQRWQLERIEKKRANLPCNSGILASSEILKFHDNDIREEFSSKWKSLYGNKKITKERFLKVIPYF